MQARAELKSSACFGARQEIKLRAPALAEIQNHASTSARRVIRTHTLLPSGNLLHCRGGLNFDPADAKSPARGLGLGIRSEPRSDPLRVGKRPCEGASLIFVKNCQASDQVWIGHLRMPRLQDSKQQVWCVFHIPKVHINQYLV